MVVIKVNYTTDQPIIKVNYDESPVYISTTVDATYISVDYGGTGEMGTVTSVDAVGGTGISVTGGPITDSGTFTITNTAPDRIVALTGAGTSVITGTYPNFTITSNDQYTGTVTSVNLTAGTGISVSGGPITTSGAINVVNTAPDQVVSLTASGGTVITGTYPNFTIYSDESSGYVPYTGATQDLNMGTYGVITDYTRYNTSSSNIPSLEGVLSWDNTNGTLDLSLKGNTYTLPIGQAVVSRVVNNTGATLNRVDYKVVRVSAAQGQRLAVSLAQANNDANSKDTLGIVCENISNNQEGFIVNVGQVTEINTTGSLQGETWADGDLIYLSPFTAGKMTNIKPTAPNHSVILGYVEYAHSQHGKIYIKIDNGYEIGELHDVYAPNPTNGQGLFWNSTNSRYQLQSVTNVIGYTPVPESRTFTINGVVYDMSANRTWEIGDYGTF